MPLCIHCGVATFIAFDGWPALKTMDDKLRYGRRQLEIIPLKLCRYVMQFHGAVFHWLRTPNLGIYMGQFGEGDFDSQ